MGYEYLLTSLPDLTLDSTAPISMEDLLMALDESLHPQDKSSLGLLQMHNDDPIILDIIERYRNGDTLAIPSWWDDVSTTLSDEDLRTAILYEYGLHSKNKFVRSWFQFNEDVNNVLVATICRKHNFDVRKLIIGTNEVAEILRKNISQKDFGLTGVLDNLSDVMSLVEVENLMEREKRLDALRFVWLENKTLFVHFSLENVLAYYLQCSMLNRWSTLTTEAGEKIFREIVSEMKSGVKI